MRELKMHLIQGDCFKVLPNLLDESVDFIITDPPYNILNTVSKIQDRAKNWDYFSNVIDYKKFSIKWINYCYDLLIEGGSLIIFWSERHLFLFNEILNNTDFSLHKILIWHYPNILKGFSNKRWHNTFDFMFHLIKGDKPKVFNASFVRGDNIDVWRFPKPQSNFKKDRKYHSTQKPLELVAQLIKILSNKGNVVLDPFLGSGTTMKACLELKRSCVGIEISEKYCGIVKKRLNWGSSLYPNIEWRFEVLE